jgi:type II secretory pathway pseudopilin PulG
VSTSDRRRRVLSGSRDEGFSLIEIVVAMGLLMGLLTASLPMLLSMLGSTITTKLNTQAKNLSQERLEQLRDLRFHVDRQNGPFLDLLDLYYTHANPSAAPTSIPSGGGTLSGRYVGTGSSQGISAPLFEVRTGALAGAPDFSQVVVAQFLAADGSVLPASRYEGQYDSQNVSGRDAPPTLMVRFTVVTHWQQSGSAKSYRTTTVITEGRPELPAIQTQAKAVAISVTSTAADTSTLQLDGGVATLDGAQSSGSSVSGYLAGALATRTGFPAVTGKVGEFVLPDQAPTTSGAGGPQSGPGCSWYGFAGNKVANVTADVAGGLPKAPADVDAATPANVVSAAITRGGSNSCGMLSFDNLVDGGIGRPTSDPLGAHMGAAPYVRVTDSSSSADGLLGSGYVTATPLLASPQQSRSGARASMSEPVVLFPGNGASGGRGVVSARVVTSAVDCTSGAAGAAGSVTGRYRLELGWWGQDAWLGEDWTTNPPRWHTATWTYDSSAATPLTVSGDAWNPSQTRLADGVTLDQVVQVRVPTASEGAVSTGATTGLRGFPNGVVTLTTAPTLTNESGPGHSAIKVQLGQLSCVADDQR